MNNTFTNKLIAYLTLLSGLSISAVAVYYSVSGLTAIFSASVIPIVIMGVTLEVGKLIATVWLKQNWKIAPWLIRLLLIGGIAVLMMVTNIGIFGFLSKAHSDQSLVTGDVQARIAVYDEKLKTEKETIDTDRKALKQLDEGVDQLMSRSTDENGAARAVGLRRSQQKERSRLLAEISASQKQIVKLNEERTPIAVESRKVEAEVGPIKYIAAFVYGNTDQALLERAVTWLIITLIVVFDPLAVILLLASQYSFQAMRPKYEKDDGPLTDDDLNKIKERVAKVDPEVNPIDLWNSMIKAAEQQTTATATAVELPAKAHIWKNTVYPATAETTSTGYIQNEEQQEGGKWKDLNKVITQKEYLEGTQRNIEEMIQRVRSGIMPFYKVPTEIKEQVKEGLKNGSEDNTNNSA
jgi:hypothetical protein